MFPFQCFQLKSSQVEERPVRQRFGTGNIFLEEILERASRDFLCRQPNIQTVAIRLVLLGEFLIHRPQHIVQTLLVPGTIANQNIEKYSQYLALGVIRNAVLRPVVQRIFL